MCGLAYGVKHKLSQPGTEEDWKPLECGAKKVPNEKVQTEVITNENVWDRSSIGEENGWS